MRATFIRLLKTGVYKIDDRILKREFDTQKHRKINERAIEYSYTFNQLTHLPVTKLLDIGSGRTALPAAFWACGYHVSAIDNTRDYWPDGVRNRHYHVIDSDITNCTLDDTFDFITCISVIEHIHDHRTAITNIYRMLAPGGSLVLSFPYNESRYVENVYDLPDAGYGKNEPYICRVYSRKEIEDWLSVGDWTLSDQVFWNVFQGPLWTMGGRLVPPEKVGVTDPHHLTCLTLTKCKYPS